VGIVQGLHGPRREIAFLAAVAVVVVGGALTAPPGRVGLDPIGYLLLVVSVGALAARRRLPVPVLLITAACLLAYQLRGYPGLVTAVPVVIAVYSAVDAGHRITAAVTVLAGFLAVVAGDLVDAGGSPAREVFQDRFLLVGWLVAAGVAAEVSRQRRAYLRQVEQRAADAERTREEAARRRAGEERLRIARELHDSLTHSISLIKVQAGVAIHLARKNDQPVPEALSAIQEASGEAMRELRATLEVLRQDGDEPAGSGLDRLHELVERARAAGLPTNVTVSGTRRSLPPVVDRTAYRIVQEALTNVARHAGPATAEVHMRYADRTLTVQIDDDGRTASGAAPLAGVGLLGMRERVTALGGSLQAGPRPVGGFTVRAELPLTDPP
jgi:signal transduction histidine kinase